MIIKRNLFILIYFFVYISNGLLAQDLHYTNYNLAKHYFNPAEAASFQGTIRVGGVYREQFSSFIHKPYSSSLLFLDSPISYGLNKNHWIGCGMIYYLDQAGDLALQNNGFIGALSYHIGFDSKFKDVLGFGFQLGSIGRTINPNNAQFEEHFVSGTKRDLALITDYKGRYTDYSIGTKYRHKLSLYSNFNVGLAVFHITEPAIKFNGGKIDNVVHRRININASYGIDLSKAVSVIPAIYFSKYTNVTNTMLQFMMEYRTFKKVESKRQIAKEKFNVQMGLGYRIQDALQFMFMGNYNNWQFGFSYDMTVSTAAIYNNYYGGFEIGINRIFNIQKKIKLPPKFYCPRF